MSQKILFSLVIFFAIQSCGVEEPGSRDGELQVTESGRYTVWNAETKRWVDIEMFWEQYSKRPGGFHWGRIDKYPPYGNVSEFDTIMIELDTGPCLMEFFHTRWRRANDVRRWDSKFNDYGGCPHVFD